MKTGLIPFVLAAAALAQPTPPLQPTSGPGGSTYSNSFIVNGPYWANNRTNDDNFKYYIYEPSNPTPASAPVILFLHGFAAFSTSNYDLWLQHMAKNGYIVIWVQYQAKSIQAPSSFAANARAAYYDALYRLQNFWWETHVKPARDANGNLKTTFVGHSAGAWLAAVLAATASTQVPVLPAPQALTLVAPGTKGLIPGADFSLIPPTTKYEVLIGDMDTLACSQQAIQIWDGTPQVTTKDFLVVRTDLHGGALGPPTAQYPNGNPVNPANPYQLAIHFYPNTDGYNDTTGTPGVDARDFFITWKLSVAAANCVNYGTNCDYAFGGGPNELDRGLWSDGVPVKPLINVKDPVTIPPIPGC